MMNSFMCLMLVLVTTTALSDAKSYSWYYPSSYYKSLARKVQSLEGRVTSLGQPVHVHVHGNDEDHSAHSDLQGAHIHMHLSVDGQKQEAVPDEWSYASCYVQPNIARRSSHGVRGYVYFRQKPSTKLEMKLDLEGFDGTGVHGFHVHEQTNYERGCNSFGGHFNPFGLTHGGPQDTIRHVGDFGNIAADDDGFVAMEMTDSLATLYGRNSIVGRGIVIHEGEDDLGKGGDEGSLKTGNAGPRLACCVIGTTLDGPW